MEGKSIVSSNLFQSFKFNCIPFIASPCSRLSETIQRSIANVVNSHVIKPSNVMPKAEVPLPGCCLNVQSLRNKAQLVAYYIVSQGFDVLAITETWLRNDTNQFVISELVLSGY